MDIREIVIVAPGMPFAATTLEHKSLGGSETAALSLAKALQQRGHLVTVFCVLPHKGSPDYIGEGGGLDVDGVRYVSINQYGPFISTTEVDLLIVQRSPELLQVNHQARKAVLWCHDLATYYGPSQAVQGVGFNFDEIWCVSHWHADQYSKVTGYPREYVKVLRNAITSQEIMPLGMKDNKQLIYAARPERGLEALVRPGGIMSRLPEFKLNISMYENYPEHMQDYYAQLFAWANALPNVKVWGNLTQLQLRQLMDDCGGYAYPTAFEETSCILAQECMERACVFMATEKGALPETLGEYGTFFNSGELEYGSDEFCEEFAQFVRSTMEVAEGLQYAIKARWMPRYWAQAAQEVEEMLSPVPVTADSLIWSLVEDSDIIPAIELLASTTSKTDYQLWMATQLRRLYPYLYGDCTFANYYENYFVREDKKGARQRRSMVGNPRFEAIAQEVSMTPPGATILDYGCAEGVIILDLAERFPDRNFIGIDFADSNIHLCRKYADEMDLKNVDFYHGSTDNWPSVQYADAVICSEVLEHVEKPWEVIGFLEKQIAVGGRVIITVPMGPWEALGLYDKEQFNWRAHIWHINKWMLRQMFADKKDCRMQSLPHGHAPDGRAIGHTTFSYEADHKAPHPVDPLQKAMRHRSRETVTAAIIVDNADTLSKTLNSIGKEVQVVELVISGDDYHCDQVVRKFMANHPWVFVRKRDGKILSPGVWGFDDARNMSVERATSDWVLWIDADEWLSGSFRKFLRRNAFDAYAIHQHHFTCDPRGAPTQMDKPARLYRTNRGFKFYGKVHEHAEKGFNGGPGFCFILPDVDIGHSGYVNENVRKDRFMRNFPFLEWDREVNPDRNIGKFLWLRDIIHRMRYLASTGQPQQARLLALDGVAFYKEHWSTWDKVGMGGEQAIQYYSEALAFMGRGLPVQLQLKVGEAPTMIQGIFDNEDEVLNVIRTHLKGQYDRKRSGYWQ